MGGYFSFASNPRKSALLIIDVQNDFCPPSGSLAVNEGTAVIPIINALRKRVAFGLIAHTQDFHPADHVSFFDNHKDDPEAKLFAPLRLPSGAMQMMWPAHCVQGTPGTEFHKDLVFGPSDKIVQKGMNPQVDSYSGFFDNDHKTKSELAKILKENNVTDVFVTGLAYDYCVGYSALDAKSEGFTVFVVEDACRGVAPDSIKAMREQLGKAGVRLVQSKDVPDAGLID